MSKILKGAGILAVCMLIGKIIGACYRIPLTNILGAEGMGLYQMVFPLYTVLLTVSSGGLPIAISKVVSRKLAKGDNAGAGHVLQVALASLVVLGAIACCLLLIFRDTIASVQGNVDASLPYVAIAPSLVFVAVISCFRGYFQGKQNMVPSAISQVIEQVVKLVAGLVCSWLLLPFGVQVAVVGALIGVSVSELVAMVVLIATYYISKRRDSIKLAVGHATAETGVDVVVVNNTISKKDKKGIIKDIYKVALPVTLGSLVMPITQVVDSVLVINLLVRGGVDNVYATSMYGLMTGPISSLINMPSVVMLSVSIALLPTLAQKFVSKESMASPVVTAMKYNFILALLCAIAFAIFGKDFLTLLYSRGLRADQISIGAMLLGIGGISIIYVSLLQVATCVLQASNKAVIPAINLVIGSVVKICLNIVLLPRLGIMGAMVSTVSCYGIICFLDVFFMCKVVKFNIEKRSFLLLPLLAGGVSSILALILKITLTRLVGGILPLILALIVLVGVFVVLLFVFRVIKKEELSALLIFKKRQKKHDETA